MTDASKTSSKSLVGLYSTTPSTTSEPSVTKVPNAVELQSAVILDPNTVRLTMSLKPSVLRAIEEGSTELILHHGTDLVRFKQKPVLWQDITRDGSGADVKLPEMTAGVQYFFQLEYDGSRTSTATASAPISVTNASPRAEPSALPSTSADVQARSSTVDPVVESEPTVTSSTPQETSPTTVGCMHEGVVHPVGAEFFMGCASKCHCVGPNFPHCVPRCWKQSVPAPGSNCTVGPDPLDPCCTVVQCFKPIVPGLWIKST